MTFRHPLRHFLLPCLFVWLTAAPALAEDAISARYSQPRGTDIRWEIIIPEPAPAAVIVIQYVRPGTVIKIASHPVASYDKQRGVAKWLLTGISPGTLRMTMQLDLPIRRKGEIHGEIMFKDENDRTMGSVLY